MMGRRGFLKFLGAGVVGLSLALRTVERKVTTIDVTQQFGVDFSWTDVEAAFEIEGDERIKELYCSPAAKQMADEWDARALVYVENELITWKPGVGLVRGG